MQLTLLRQAVFTYPIRRKSRLFPKLVFFLFAFVATLCIAFKSSAQSITIKADHAPLQRVLKQIGKQAKYEVFFRADQINFSKPVTINAVNTDMKTVLAKIFADQPFSYTLTNNTIVIVSNTKSFYTDPSVKSGQGNILVTGKVTDSVGTPYEGVIVEADKGNAYSVTNDQGLFSLSLINTNVRLKLSGLAIIPHQEELRGRTKLDIIIRPKVNVLKEVIINKGYYTEAQRASTGDVITVRSADIVKTPTTNPIIAIQGRVPGLYISQTSGLPGATPNVQLRGLNSIANGTSPLYIIDGIPYNSQTLSVIGGNKGLGSALTYGISPLSALNPADIDEITVLKDADATAIYGSRGANGVILISTKKGIAGKTVTNFNISQALSQYGKFEDLLNTQQYISVRQAGLRNDGAAPSSSDYDINGTWSQSRYTNWQKALLGSTAHLNNYQASISGGDQNTQFIVNGTYRTQSLVYTHSDGLGDKLGSIRANINHTSPNKKLGITVDLNYINDRNTVPVTDPTSAALTLPPNAPALYNATNSLNWENGTFQNPLAGLLQTAKATTDNLIGNLGLRYRFNKAFNFNLNLGYNRQALDELTLLPGTAISPFDSFTKRNAAVGHSTNNSWIAEPQLNFERGLLGGKISALVGGTFQRNTTNSYGFIATGAPNDAVLQDLSSAPTSGLTAIRPTYNDFKYDAIYFRLNYNLQSKYLLNVTARRDGSSRFGPENRFGNFGAVGAAWIFSEEEWAKKISWMNLGKIRASYGITGNDQLNNYAYLSYYNYGNYNYQGISTLVPSGLSNPDVHWEVNKKLELGIDFGFLNDRIDITANYFRNRSGNQLVYNGLPDIAGFSTVVENLPAVVQNRGFEGILNTVNIKSNNFSWKSSFNISTIQNKLLSFPGLAKSGYANLFKVGQSLFSRQMYHFLGVDPATGVYTFQDVNKDGQLTPADYVTSKPVGPSFFGGFNNSFNYKRLQLDVFVQFVKQTQISFLTGSSPGSFGNKPVTVLDAWQQPGDNSAIQRYTVGSFGSAAGPAYSQYQLSDGRIVDASFIRIKNVNLNYTLPETVNKALHTKSVKIYITADNLLTFTKYVGPDPETAGTYLPPLRTLLLGLNVSL